MLTHGWGAEVAAGAQEQMEAGFVLARVASRDMPVPAAGPLERAVLPTLEGIVEAARHLSRATTA